MTKIKYLVLLMCAVVFSVNSQETADNNDVEEVVVDAVSRVPNVRCAVVAVAGAVARAVVGAVACAVAVVHVVAIVVEGRGECVSKSCGAEAGETGVVDVGIIFFCIHGGRKPSALSSDDARGGA